MVKDKDIDKLQLVVIFIVTIAVVGAFLRAPVTIIEWLIQWLISMFVGGVLSIIAGEFVEAFTGDFLKTIALTIKIFGFDFSISAFFVATVIVKYLLFRSL